MTNLDQKARPPRLTGAQRSFLKRLHLNGGRDRLYHATYGTAVALSDKGMVTIEVVDPMHGRVSITKDGEQVAKAIINLLSGKPPAAWLGKVTP